MITRPLRRGMRGRVELHCDGLICERLPEPQRRRFKSKHWRARKARAHAAEYGWSRVGALDLCERDTGPQPPLQPRRRGEAPGKSGITFAATARSVDALRQQVGAEGRRFEPVAGIPAAWRMEVPDPQAIIDFTVGIFTAAYQALAEHNERSKA